MHIYILSQVPTSELGKKKSPCFEGDFLQAREVGIEPTTNRLTGDRSTAELPRNIFIYIELIHNVVILYHALA